MTEKEYRGRIAPSPTGYLHLGHAMTFWCAQERARAAGGKLVLRIEDIDRARCRPEFARAIIEDLRWFEMEWDEGPDVGGAFAPYVQSERRLQHRAALEKLRAAGSIYPCVCSRKDLLEAASAPHAENEEPIYPGTCRPSNFDDINKGDVVAAVRPRRQQVSQPGYVSRNLTSTSSAVDVGASYNWRFRVPDGEKLSFVDHRLGLQTAIAGREFGDFIVWRRDDVPSYQLAVAVDDAAMEITEVVRGEDLLVSTFRQLLIYRALGLAPPSFFHARLIVDESGRRLAKRDRSMTLRALRASGIRAEELRACSGGL